MRKTLPELIRGLLDGTLDLLQIGSVRVGKGAKAEDLVIALETQQQAEQFSKAAQMLMIGKEYSGALNVLCQSIVLEESLGNYWGLASDIGNLAETYRQMQDYATAENVFDWLLNLDRTLIRDQSNRTTVGPKKKELDDYHFLLGLHTEGLARVYIATGRKVKALPLAVESIDSYTKAGRRDAVNRGKELVAYLHRSTVPSAN